MRQPRLSFFGLFTEWRWLGPRWLRDQEAPLSMIPPRVWNPRVLLEEEFWRTWHDLKQKITCRHRVSVLLYGGASMQADNKNVIALCYEGYARV